MPQHTVARGLAVSAVGALAVTGLTVPPAHASPSGELLSIFNASHVASVRRDANWSFGFDSGSTITLTATAEDFGDTTVWFEYNVDPSAGTAAGGWTDTGGAVDYHQGLATTEWTPDNSLLGTTVAVRMVASDLDGTTYDIRNNVSIKTESDPVHSVRLGDMMGYFAQPYADSGRTATLLSVQGTTSATSGKVALSWWRPSQHQFQGQTNASVGQISLKTAPSTYRTAGAFQSALDITAFGAGPGKLIAVAAQRGSDEVRPVALYEQEPSITVDFPDGAAPTTADVLVRVVDQSLLPVVGAEVRRESDGTLVGYTDDHGELQAAQAPGSTETYYVNTTDTDAYQELIDATSGPMTAPEWAQVATSTVPVLVDGTVFDDDEYAAGDIYLQVRDQLGAAFGAGAEIDYALYPTGTTAPPSTTALTNAQGRVVIPFDPAGPDGSYTLEYTPPTGAPSSTGGSVTFTAGDSTLSLTPAAGTARSGGRITYTGSLRIGGLPLPGRSVALAFQRGTEVGGVADAGIGNGRALTGSTTTATDGTFTVVVADADETNRPAETGGKLGATVASAAETAQATASFTARLKAKLTLKGKHNGKKADVLTVDGPPTIAGEQVVLHRKQGKKWVVVLSRTLGSSGDVKLKVRDRNGTKVTQYRATLVASDKVDPATSNVRSVK